MKCLNCGKETDTIFKFCGTYCEKEYNTKSGNECCPLCGGESGYMLRYIKRVEHIFGWDGEVSDHLSFIVRGGTIKYCIDCKKGIRNE